MPDLLSHKEVLDQLSIQHKQSLNYVQSRREDFRTRLKLYNNQKKQKDKIGILTMYTAINTLLSVYYNDELTVSFSGRSIASEAHSSKWNKLAEFDQEEMGLDEVNYWNQWNKLFYGVGIRAISSYDTSTQTPKVENVDPLSWLPDPSGKHRWHGFEKIMDKEVMTSEAGYITSAVSRVQPMSQDAS